MVFRFGLIFFFMGWSAVRPSQAQDLETAAPAAAQVRLTPASESQTFKQEDLSVDIPNKQIVRQTQEFQFRAYRDHASAVATGCQVFKERDENLWWANCGRPINDMAVVSNMSAD